MRWLILSSTPTHAPFAGNRVRIYSMLRRLKDAGERVHFALARREPFSSAEAEAMHACWNDVEIIETPRPSGTPKGETFFVDDWFTREIGLAFREIARRLQPDVVLVNYVMYSRAFELAPPSAVRVLDTHDRFADRHRLLDQSGIRRNFFWTTQAEEQRGLDRADIVLAIQASEREAFQAQTRAEVMDLGQLAVDVISRRHWSDLPSGPPRFGMLGSDNLINVKHFQATLDAWAAHPLQAHLPLTIAGTVTGRLHNPPAATRLLGPVDDSGSFFKQVDILLNPVEHATGLAIKSVEALYRGAGVIATAAGFQGLQPKGPWHCCGSLGELLDFTRRAAVDPGLARAIITSSREAALDYQQATDKAFATFLDRVAERVSMKRAA